jgi:hypothetical protein
LSEATLRFLDDKVTPAHAFSLAEAVSALNRRAADPSPTYKLDPMYAAKRVTLLGTEKLPAEVLLRTLAAVYGLRGVQEEKNHFLLTHSPTVEAERIFDLGRALQSAFPAPISRAIRTCLPADRSAIKGFPGMERPVFALDYPEKASAIHHAAMQMFRYLAEPAAKSQPNAKILLSQLGERTRNMFAIASTMNLFAQDCSLADRPLPPYIANIDQIRCPALY